MNIDRDKLMIDLYNQNIRQDAEIKILKGLLLNLIEKTTGPTSEVASAFYDDALVQAYSDFLLNSELRDQFLNDQAERALNKLKRDLGF